MYGEEAVGVEVPGIREKVERSNGGGDTRAESDGFVVGCADQLTGGVDEARLSQ